MRNLVALPLLGLLPVVLLLPGCDPEGELPEWKDSGVEGEGEGTAEGEGEGVAEGEGEGVAEGEGEGEGVAEGEGEGEGVAEGEGEGDCADDCVLGDKKCSVDSQQLLVCRQPVAGGCTVWEVERTCDIGTTCHDGESGCVLDPVDTCHSEGATACGPDNQGVTTCVRGADGYLGWSDASPCPAGEPCQDGHCVCANDCDQAGARQCAGDGFQTCGAQNDLDACLEWSEVRPCPAQQHCEGAGECTPDTQCASPCETSGVSRCTEDGKTQICVPIAGAGSCLNWSVPVSCDPGDECVDGDCVESMIRLLGGSFVGGGGTMTGGEYVLQGVILPLAGGVMQGGEYILVGGAIF